MHDLLLLHFLVILTPETAVDVLFKVSAIKRATKCKNMLPPHSNLFHTKVGQTTSELGKRDHPGSTWTQNNAKGDKKGSDCDFDTSRVSLLSLDLPEQKTIWLKRLSLYSNDETIVCPALTGAIKLRGGCRSCQSSKMRTRPQSLIRQLKWKHLCEDYRCAQIDANLLSYLEPLFSLTYF